MIKDLLNNNEVDLVVPMIHNIEMVVTKTAGVVAEFIGFSTDQIEEMNQALIEACINSIEHSKSEDRKLYVKFILKNEELTVVIRDNGQGFAINEVEENPNIKDKLKSDYKRGWGIMLIKSLMDKVEIESGNQGTILKMTKIK